MGQRGYEWDCCRRAAEDFRRSWGFSVRRSLLIPVLFLGTGLLSHYTLGGRGNPFDEFSIWVHYALVPAFLWLAVAAVWYVGRAPYRLAAGKEEEIERLREALDSPPRIEFRESAFEFIDSKGRSYLIFPKVMLVNHYAGHRFEPRAEIRRWDYPTRGLRGTICQDAACPEWEVSRDADVYHACSLSEMGAFEGGISKVCYLAFLVDSKFVNGLMPLKHGQNHREDFGLVQVAVTDEIRGTTLFESTWIVRRSNGEETRKPPPSPQSPKSSS